MSFEEPLAEGSAVPVAGWDFSGCAVARVLRPGGRYLSQDVGD